MPKSEPSVQIATENLKKDHLLSNEDTYADLFTHQEVQDLVRRATDSEATVRNFSLKPYSDGKLGVLSSHLKLDVHFKTGGGTDNSFSFFVKAVPYEVSAHAEYVLEKQVFMKEGSIYRDIVPQLSRDYNGESWTSNCYLVKDNLLVFEDLGAKGYSVRNKLFDKQLMISGLTAIARFHASSLLAEARLGRSLKEMYPQAFVETGYTETGLTRAWFDTGVNAIIAIAEYLGLDASMISKACEQVYSAIQPSSTKRNVISHGDLWGNNLMFSDTVPPKCLLIDFQLFRYASLAHDVTQFLYLCGDRDFRLRYEETMFKHYYSTLRDTLNSTRSISVKVPSWSELTEGIEEQRLAAVVTAAIFFPTVLLDGKLCAEILGDPEKYHYFEFKDRSEVVLNVMKIDPVYNKRMTEIVTEVVELSLRLVELPKPT